MALPLVEPSNPQSSTQKTPPKKVTSKTLFGALITGVALVSTTLLTAGCSKMDHADHVGSANVVDATGGHTATQDGSEAAEAKMDHGSGHDHGVKTNHDIYHSKTIEVPAGTPVPAITVRVDTDAVRGWNLYVGTANFDFTPSKVNGESSATAGHAHLYINDEPIQRIYSTWTHLPELPAGENDIRVTLNANGHETLTTQGTPIEDSVTVEVYKPESADSGE